MELSHRLAPILELVEAARREWDEAPTTEKAEALREALTGLDAELHGLQSLLEDVETRLTVLEIIATTRDPEEALVGALRYLSDRLGVDASGLRLREGDDFPYYTTEGFSSEFVLSESSLCQVDGSGTPVRDALGNVVLECMCGNVLQRRVDPLQPFFTNRGSFWTNSTSELLARTTEQERMGPTRNRCQGEGYESVALIPLTSHEEIFGLLQFNDHDAGKFTPQKIALLEDLAFYLARLLA